MSAITERSARRVATLRAGDDVPQIRLACRSQRVARDLGAHVPEPQAHPGALEAGMPGEQHPPAAPELRHGSGLHRSDAASGHLAASRISRRAGRARRAAIPARRRAESGNSGICAKLRTNRNTSLYCARPCGRIGDLQAHRTRWRWAACRSASAPRRDRAPRAVEARGRRVSSQVAIRSMTNIFICTWCRRDSASGVRNASPSASPGSFRNRDTFSR